MMRVPFYSTRQNTLITNGGAFKCPQPVNGVWMAHENWSRDASSRRDNNGKLNYNNLTLIRQFLIVFSSSALQTIRWWTWKSVGMRLMAGVHIHRDTGHDFADWSNGADIDLGDLLPWRFCMARKSENSVQFASCADGGRFHHSIWIL